MRRLIHNKHRKRRQSSIIMALSMPPFISTIVLGLSLIVAGGLYSTLSALVQCPGTNETGPANLLMENFSTNNAYPNPDAPQNSIFRLSKPIEILKPNVESDDDLMGKTCRFQTQTRDWECRDCGLDYAHSYWNDCPLLERSHMCGDLVDNNDWDRPQPRKYTYMDPLSTETRNIITHYADQPKHFEQIACDERIDECWDFSKCPADKPMTVYVHHNAVNPKKNKARRYIDLAAERYPDDVEVVTDPNEACLLVVACDAYEDISELQGSPVWREGRNHFIWEANRCFGTRADRPFDFPWGIHYSRASLASSSLMDANIRKGYDVALARTKSFHISEQKYAEVLDSIGQPRKWLVAFKGNVYNDWSQVWWAHRWMAAEYWPRPEDDPEVAVDVTCDIKQNYTDAYDYLSLLTNSTFAFCPGGGATQSFRFTEALGLGAIPVTTPELLPPFAYDLDWSGCVVQVSEARIVDLPRILRQIPREEILQRQQRCQELFKVTVGWIPDRFVPNDWKIDVDRTLFMTSLKVWKWRIEKYHEAKKAQKNLEQSLFVVSKESMKAQ